MTSRTATTEPQLFPSPPPSPPPPCSPNEEGAAVLGPINEAYLTPDLSTTNKGKGRMVDDPVEPRQSHQDIDGDEYPPDETETKRIEEVSEVFIILVPSLIHVLSFDAQLYFL